MKAGWIMTSPRMTMRRMRRKASEKHVWEEWEDDEAAWEGLEFGIAQRERT